MYEYDTYFNKTPMIRFGTWSIIATLLAIAGGFLVYFMFIKQDKKLPNKFLVWLKDFADFKNMLIEPILKITYLILAIYITLNSFSLISISFISFILTLVLGNIILRIIYESALILIMIWKNTSEINKKMK